MNEINLLCKHCGQWFPMFPESQGQPPFETKCGTQCPYCKWILMYMLRREEE